MPEQDYIRLQNGSDVRGVALPFEPGEPVNLTPEIARDIARAFLGFLSHQFNRPAHTLTIGVGMDSRLSGPLLKAGIIEGLTSCGAKVYDFALCSTPALFMATVLPDYPCDGSIMITASHLPKNRNGMKFFGKEGGLEKQDISNILSHCTLQFFPPAHDGGSCEEVDFLAVYSRHLRTLIQRGINDPDHYETPLSGLKICVDAGGGAGGFFATQVLAPLGADVSASQFLEPDGTFSGHQPNPENKEAMASACRATVENNCDFGIIFDTDVDRAGAVDAQGKEINRNRLIALLSAILLKEKPGGTIVTDSVTSSELTAFLTARSGRHHRFKRGYRNVINEAIRLNKEGVDCPLAIETSGHGALRENYFLDDGAYIIARLLIELGCLKREGKTLNSLLDGFSEPLESAEIRLKIAGDDFKQTGEKVLAALSAFVESDPGLSLETPNYEGVRVNVPAAGGWFLLRQSLHDPILPLNLEANKPGGVLSMERLLLPVLKQFPALDLTPLEKGIAKGI